MAIDADYERYRAEIERLLDLARKLPLELQERIRKAVSRRQDDLEARKQIDGTDAEDVGSRLLAQLVAADGELEPARVYELLVLIDAGLAD